MRMFHGYVSLPEGKVINDTICGICCSCSMSPSLPGVCFCLSPKTKRCLRCYAGYPYPIGSLGRLYMYLLLVDFYGKLVGKYTMPIVPWILYGLCHTFFLWVWLVDSGKSCSFSADAGCFRRWRNHVASKGASIGEEVVRIMELHSILIYSIFPRDGYLAIFILYIFVFAKCIW